ncbi:hydroxymethylpyrimidine kinase / phosphomethylpyrimidine kinase / thiamine-phosphate diphosphorylase [Malonomonas rubra DSM 5091]|uniref:Thiamine-phosphate synthase n=1 Tax=Malonomonas rubra DSM 5091 TaxID=1122189 RepID=A0A1M6E8T3_MALRU|nr:bifunctional hydroxymethylpyrimidine kinase/phosphomethylpyrimidine kinase [Malonomonas rubra]SHI81872.1 hydroxymethylpyrimidine kinase / phosphomethylpyrimidine kinase / thiamine-phosphate diphosphorylase [Malonomonas rubra DSM 5091]
MLSGLYLITDENRDGRLAQKVEAALKGGAAIVQYRAKEVRPDDRHKMAQKLRDLCTEYGAKLIINDLPELARDINADGVHLGQDDMPAVQARQILGGGKIIGISTHSVEEALKAEAQGADYIAIGSIFPTGTKDDTTLVGLDMLRNVRKAVRVPLVAIGGITPEGAFEALEAGADSVAVISGVMADSDPARAAKEYSLLFNRGKDNPNGRVMTIAGSDSGGGAGIQADIKTITLLGSYASSALTALTAQNTLGVAETYQVHTDFVIKQIETILDDIGTDTVKTGMLSWGGIVTRIAKVISDRSLLAVVDPVMVAKGGESLLDKEANESLISRLLPEAYLLTPNLPEVTAMTGIEPSNIDEMIEAGQNLQALGARNILIKGGHLDGDATDILLLGENEYRLTGKRFDTINTHGTGCTLSSAIATFLAQGYPLRFAVERAKRFVSLAIESSVQLGKGHGPVNHFQAAMQLLHEQASVD